jgi:hypothetical protein
MSRLFRARRLLQRSLHEYAVEQGIIKAHEPAPENQDDKVRDLASYRAEKQRPGPGGAR